MFSNIRPNTVYYISIAAASITLSTAIYFLSANFYFPLDDAYIVIDNAQTLLSRGVDDSYHQPPLVGSTSAVHLLFVAVFGRVFDIEISAFLVVSVFAVLYALGLARLFLQISQSIWVALAGVSIGLFMGNALYQLYGGLETGLAMAAVVWCLSLTISRSRTALPILCGVMYFIRPELAALSLGSLAWRWYYNCFDLRVVRRDVVFFLMGFLPWIAWFYFTTGHVSAQTGSAKIAFFAEATLPARVRLRIFLTVILKSTLLPILLGIVFLGRRPFTVPAIAFSCALLAAFFIYLPGGLAHNHARYLYLLMPIGLTGYICVISRFSDTLRLPLVLVLVGTIFFLSPPQLDDFRSGTPIISEDGLMVGKWAQENLPPDARVLVHDAGAFAWATSFETTDIVGLRTPSSIAFHKNFTLPSAGQNRSKAVSEIARFNDITHAVILNDFFWEDLAKDLRKEGWKLTPIREPNSIGYVVYEISKQPQIAN